MPGHPHDLSDEQTETIRRRRAEGGTLEQIAAELKVHHSTVARYVQETEPSKPSDRYSAMVVEIRAALEANFREALSAAEAGDYHRMTLAMKARALLTQQAKGVLVTRDLFVERGDAESPESREAAHFIAGLAKGKGEDASTTTNGGDQSSARAASRAT
jgi:AcrR family transcriptional regulator